MTLIDSWHGLLRPDQELTARFCSALTATMRERRLTFGTRLHCPFLRPFFLTSRDEKRIKSVAETIAAAGERVVRAAMESPIIFDQLGVTDAESELIRIDPRYQTASTASRLDAFLLPDSLHCAEYNAESPAGPGYTQRLNELFDALPVMSRFRQGRTVSFRKTIDALLDALVASYKEWGGTANPPVMAIVDLREVPTWTEFEILSNAFTTAGVPTIVCDPRELVLQNGALFGQGRRIDLVYRRVLVNDILARRRECAPLVEAYSVGAVCVANTFRCKLAHKKAFFAVLTDSRNENLFSGAELEVFQAHVPWTRLLADIDTDKNGRRVSLMQLARLEREQLVLKPNDQYGGKGVVLGWEASESEWESALNAALADPPGTWVLQERISVRREVFPQFDALGRVAMREMLVDLAPFLFRGRMAGFLTRLSATSLANVTAGGGQVPAFIVD